MIKHLKTLVISLAILIFLLLSITIVAIFKKYKNNETKSHNGFVIPSDIFNQNKLHSFDVDKDKLYIFLTNNLNNKHSIIIYDLKSGKQIGKILIGD